MARSFPRETKSMAIVKPRMTEDEFMRMPDDGRKYELVDGEAKEVPGGVEQDVTGAHLTVLLYPFTRGRGYLAGSQAGFRMRPGNIRAPDISFTLKERFPGGRPPKGFGNFAPDLCIEIISPSEDEADMTRKVAEYFATGAQQVWHLFPESMRARVYRSPTETTEHQPEDILEGGDLLPGFRCRAADLFDIE
jgi:Uma2 family endonuclease